MLSQITDFFSLVPGGKEVVTLVMVLTLTILFSIIVRIAFSVLTYFAQKTKTTLDDEIIRSMRSLFYYLVGLTAIYVSVYANYGDIKLEGMALLDLYVIGVFVLSAISINRIIDVLLVWYVNEISPTKAKVKTKVKTKNVFPFVRNVVKILIYVAFAILILGKLGVEVGPLVAGLGIAGLAVALALQDTLSNFFAGIHLLADKPFREGDLIRLDNGMEGTVTTIGWRTTKVTTTAKNDIVIPNAKLAQSIIVNYYTSDRETGVTGEIGVSYKEDVKKVEKIILNALKTVQKKNSKIVQNIEPWVRLDKFGDYALIFRYGYTVENFGAQFNVLAEVNKALFYEFKKNKIEMPFPIRPRTQ